VNQPTGCGAIDELLGGGFLKPAVNLLYGDTGSGKTTLASMTSIDVMKAGKPVYYLDTEEGFSRKRLDQMAQAAGLEEEAVESLFKLYEATSLVEQHKIIIHAWDEDANRDTPGLFVVDSLVNHYHKDLLAAKQSFLAVKSRELQGRLAYQIGKLLDLSSKYGATTILVSWSRSAAGRSFQEQQRAKMMEKGELTDIELGLGAKQYDVIGGRHLEYNSKAILRMISLKESYERLALLEKHKEMPTPTLVLLSMSEAGLAGAEKEGKRVHHLDSYYQSLIEEALEDSRPRRKRPGSSAAAINRESKER